MNKKYKNRVLIVKKNRIIVILLVKFLIKDIFLDKEMKIVMINIYRERNLSFFNIGHKDILKIN